MKRCQATQSSLSGRVTLAVRVHWIERLLIRSLRDVYYRDPALFGRQSVVDRHIDSIASSLNVPRADLNIVRYMTQGWLSPANVQRPQEQKALSTEQS